MAGRLVRTVSIRQFQFAEVAPMQAMIIIAARQIDVSWAREITLCARLHDGTIGSNGKISVVAFPDGYTTEDPAANFIGDTACGTIELTSSTTAPYYTTYKLGSGANDAVPGPMIAIGIAGEQPSPAVTLVGTLSVDVLGQE